MQTTKTKVQALDANTFPHPPRVENQRPVGTLENLSHMLQQYGVEARYNVIKKKVELDVPENKGCSDNLHAAAMSKVYSFAALNKLPVTQVNAYLDALANANPYNPVREWIESSPWDGIDRLPEFNETLKVPENYPPMLRDILLRKWLISAVAAAYTESGFKARGVLTLQGGQGLGKTTWVRNLVSDAALSDAVIRVDHHLDASNKDSILGAISNWLVEIGELDSSFKKDVARLKGFLTSDQDRVRRPYAAAESEYSRRTVFCATVNDHGFLVDHTGNSRFWTIPVAAVNSKHGIDMQQLWAQVAEIYKTGEEWWLNQDEEQLLEALNANHRVTSVIRDLFLDMVDYANSEKEGARLYTPTELLKELGITHPTNAQAKECAAILREYIGESRRLRGANKWKVMLYELDRDSPLKSEHYGDIDEDDGF